MEKIRLMFMTATVSGGGAERMLFNIINSLPLDKYEILFINTSCEDASKQLKKGINIYNCNKKNANKALGNLWLKTFSFSPAYIFTTSFNLGYVLILLKLLFLNKFKVIIRIAVPPSEYPLNDIRTNVVRFVSKILFRYADTFIAQTEFSKQDVIQYYKINPNKVKVIRNIIDKPFLLQQAKNTIPEEFRIGNYNIVASGALYFIKGFDFLIKAFYEVSAKCTDAYLYILGKERYEQGYRNYLDNLIAELNLSDRVFLIGHKENPYPYYKNADLFVLSSIKEGFPNVVLESLFLSTPVVVTDCVDFTDIVSSEINGYVVKKGNIAELSEGIVEAYNNLRKPVEYKLENFNYESIFV